MYRLGEVQQRRHNHRLLIISVVLLLLVAAAAIGAKYFLKPETTLTQAQAVVGPATLPHAEKYEVVKGPTFSLEVPTTWKQTTPPAVAYTIYRWQGTTVNDEQRWTDVYVDTIPSDFAVNHMTPIKADGDKISTINGTSDNCANFTDAVKTTPKLATAPAKWSGVAFVCDLGNTARDVVGTATAETGNAVVLKGVGGTHRYFFVYTDNSVTPDYNVFTRQLESFRSL
jgi:hypothetical protein